MKQTLVVKISLWAALLLTITAGAIAWFTAQHPSSRWVALIAWLAAGCIWLRLRAEIATPSTPPSAPAPKAPAPATLATQPAVSSAPDHTALHHAADGGALRLLSRLQAEGRLIDFATEDIHAVPDSQVAAVARVVHAGVRTVLQRDFQLAPARTEAEGAALTLPAGFDPESVRLIGAVKGEAPYHGTLLHRGWTCTAVRLPRPLRPDAAPSPIVAPAEIELK